MNARTKNTQTGHEVGTLVHVEPGTLLMQRNVREAKPDADLIRSVKEVGVLEPIVAVLTDTGDLLVRYGHRRTLAAIEAKQATVPVYVTGQDSTENADEVVRVVSQRDENTHRAGLTTAEEIGVVETLTGLGLSAAQVAKKARIRRGDVDTALAVSGSKIARKATDRYADLSLEQAGVLAEFEDDTETVKALVVAASEGKFEHVAQRARDDRDEAAARAAVLAMLAEAGVSVIERPDYGDTTTQRLDNLRLTAEDKSDLTAENHSQCPGHVAWLGTQWVKVDASGQPVEDSEPDEPDTEGMDEDAADQAWAEYEAACEAACQRAQRNSRQVQRPVAVYGCQGWKKHGHNDRYAYTTSRTPKEQQSEAEREEAKAARRLVIENNKAWAAAEPVRREFVAQLAKAKTPPKGTSRFLAVALCRDASVIGTVSGNALAAEWLGKKHSGYGYTDLSPAKTATENRAQVLALVQVLAAYEADVIDSSWRRDGTDNATGRYLRFLRSAGYVLADVEEYAISNKTA